MTAATWCEESVAAACDAAADAADRAWAAAFAKGDPVPGSELAREAQAREAIAVLYARQRAALRKSGAARAGV